MHRIPVLALALLLVLAPGCSRPKHDEAFFAAVDRLMEIRKLMDLDTSHPSITEKRAMLAATIEKIGTTNHLAELKGVAGNIQEQINLYELHFSFIKSAPLAASRYPELYPERMARARKLEAEFNAFMALVRANR